MSEHLLRFSFLWRYASQWKWEILRALASLTVVSITPLIYPWLLKLMVDQFSGQAIVAENIHLLAGLLVVLFLLSTILGYHQLLTMNSLGFRLRNALRVDLYRNLVNRPMEFHRSQQVGELSARATEDIGKIQPLFLSLVSPIYQNILVISGGLILSIVLNWIATLLLVCFLLIPLPFILRHSRKIRSLGAESQAEHAQANANLEEALVAIREVKAFAREDVELNRYAGFLGGALRNEMTAVKMAIRGNQSAYFLLSAMLLALFYLTAVSAIPNWTLGSMVASYFYAYTMAMALLSSARIYLTYQSVTGALDRVVDLISDKSYEYNSEGTTGKLLGTIVFKNISFGYTKGKQVLNNISFSILDGAWVVIGGPSGSGKSTIASLIMGFYRPDSGHILIGGQSIESWDIRALRKQMGYVGQDPMLFHGTLRENLILGERDVRKEELDNVLRTSCLDDMIAELPDGLDTIVGERGFTLSGGQKARVAIARALLLDPVVLILDEPNAMLEEKLESELWNNLISMRQKQTTVILTHHEAQIPKVYTSFFIEHGAVREHRSMNPIDSSPRELHRARTQ